MTTPRGTRDPIIKAATAAAAVASVEWYDFFVYGTAAALIFPKLFFPGTLSPFVAQIAAFSTFAVGFLARPIGGAMFGHIGDLLGRKRALVLALVLMGSATTLIGLLPGYAVIGDFAPLLLVILRFIQGLAVGGQWGGAALLAIENAPPNRRGFYGSFAQIGVPAGLVLANAILYIVGIWLEPAAFQSWGWRVPFVLSLLIVGIGLYVQFRIEETKEFSSKVIEQAEKKAAEARKRSPIWDVIRTHPKEIVLAGGAFIANNICFYVAITYAIAYGTATLHMPKQVMLSAVMLASAAMVPALILAGWLSDKWGRLKIFMAGAVLAGIWAFAFFPLMETKSPLLITLDIMIEMFPLSVMYGPQAALFADLFPVKMRYSGASLGYQVGSVVGGGFAPIIATALYEEFNTTFSIGLYMFFACAITFVCTYLLGRSVNYGAGQGRVIT